MTPAFLSKEWDAFDINQRDYASVDEQNVATFKYDASKFVNRLVKLAIWLRKILDQPSALYWASLQSSLSRLVINTISRELQDQSRPIHPLIRQRWQILIDMWKNRAYFTNDQLFLLKKERDWNTTVVEQFEKLTRPHLFIKSSTHLQPIPQKLKVNRKNINQFAPVDIKYPHFDQPLDIPDKWCSAAVKALRRNLEIAISCEKEIGIYGGIILQPIICVNGSDNYIERTHHLSGMIIYFAKLFDQLCKGNLKISISLEKEIGRYGRVPLQPIIFGKKPENGSGGTHHLFEMILNFAKLFDQLCKIDLSAAKFEFLSWPRNDDIVFAHLRIWAAGKAEIVADDEFGQFISSLPDEILWNPQHQRDLLIMLKKRWDNLNSSTRAMIEKRLLKNSSRLSNEDQYTRKKRHAWLSLNSLWWLKFNGCELSSATQKKAQKLRSVEPEWTEKQARNAARRLTSGFIKSNTDYTALLNIPLSELLPEAEKIQQGRNAISVVNKPFEGVARDKPVRAFSALCFEAKKGIFRPWAWQTFFYSKPHKADQNRFNLLITNRLLNYPDEQIGTIITPVVFWLSNNAEKPESTYIPDFFHLAKKLVKILRIQPDNDQSNIEQSTDTYIEAINVLAGMMARTLLAGAFVQNLNDKYFYNEWFKQIESLLKLPDNTRQYVLVILFTHINWFFQIDKNWTRKNLLPIFHSSNSIARDAAWSGFLESRALPHLEIFKTIKGDLFTVVQTRPYFYLKYINRYSGLILALWSKTDDATAEKCITDDELHELLIQSEDELRTEILKQVEVWIRDPNTDNSSDEWKSRLPELFSIWPKQMKAWSPVVSAGFFRLLLWSGEQFPVLLKLVIKRLNKIYELPSADLYSLTVSGFGNTIIQDYPKELLELLFSVLPDDARQWSYEMNIILEQIIEADSSLKKDERYIELKRRYSI